MPLQHVSVRLGGYLYGELQAFSLIDVARALDAEGNHTPLVECVQQPKINIMKLKGRFSRRLLADVVVQQSQNSLVQGHPSIQRGVDTERGLFKRLKLGRYPVIGA